jgi:hypothetical protein
MAPLDGKLLLQKSHWYGFSPVNQQGTLIVLGQEPWISHTENNKLTRVCAHVYLQQSGAMELLVAMLAVVFLLALHLACMCTQMFTQVVLATKHASTHLQAKYANFRDGSCVK